MSAEEQVMVVRRDWLEENGCSTNSKIITENIRCLYQKIIENHSYCVRREAEIDRDVKQIIPYVVVIHEQMHLLFRRKAKQTEARLHDKYSLGVGGHINPTVQKEDPIVAGLYREFHEELDLDGYSEPKFIGLINDESADVGIYHLGILFSVIAASSRFSLPESEKMSAEWADKEGLFRRYDLMETWSQRYCDFLWER